jgi:hypothetical protein
MTQAEWRSLRQEASEKVAEKTKRRLPLAEGGTPVVLGGGHRSFLR